MFARFRPSRNVWGLSVLFALSTLLAVSPTVAAPVDLLRTSPAALRPQQTSPATYTNPIPVKTPDGALVESCADPTIIRGAQNDPLWYMYCTTDPLNGADRDSAGKLNFHKLPMFTSSDLVNWTYAGDAFSSVPSWGAPTAGIWAPEIAYLNNTYYLYYTMTDVADAVSGVAGCGGDSAIGVATSASPLGPWTDSGGPVIAPRQNGMGCEFFWTFDPDLLVDAQGQAYLYYGSYYGGIYATRLNAQGTAVEGTPTQITIANRYEGAYVLKHDDFYYLFVSATNCCNGPLTGYSVFAGRSASPLGPFVDREGVSLLDARVGGNVVISMNGNRWVGAGHNTTVMDAAGQEWFVYHAADRNDPYFTGEPGFTKRPVLLDPLDWIDGWPTVRGGRWASDTPQPAPVTQAAQQNSYRTSPAPADVPGQLLPTFSDEFNGSTLSEQWSWVRPPITTTYGLISETLRFDTQNADLFVDSNNASVLTRPMPTGDYVVETRVKLDVPAEGCCYNYTQAGMVIYGDDDNFIKLVHFSLWDTRQTEFAKEQKPVPDKFPRYGNTVVGPPDEWTFLRIVRRMRGSEEHYTGYTSRDGQTWERGGTWTHTLGANARIGLVSMAASGFTANFDYVRVSNLTPLANLALAQQTSATTVYAGAPLTYTLQISNTGLNAAPFVTVTTTLPAGSTFVSATGEGWNCTPATGSVSCTRASLDVGASSTIRIVVNTSTSAATLSSVVRSAAVEEDETNNTVSANVAVQLLADVGASVTSSAMQPDNTLSYALRVNNSGPSATGSVTATITLPRGVAFISATGAGWNCAHNAGVVTCTTTNLGVGNAPAIQIVVRAPVGGVVDRLSVTISTAATDSNQTNNTVSASGTVRSIVLLPLVTR